MDLTQIKTKTGKTIADFKVPQNLIDKDPELVELILRSESMNDNERQYWFNLTAVMNQQQVEKLRDILTRERQKLAEIEAKYAQKPKLSPEEVAKRNAQMAQNRAAKQKALAEKEAAEEKNEDEDSILAELESV